MAARQPREVIAEARALASPASDPEIGVVALREHPSVATRHDAQLDDGRPLDVSGAEVSVRDVPLERDTVDDPRIEPGRARHDPVGAVRADERVGAHDLPAHAHADVGCIHIDIGDSRSIAELGARRRCLLREMRVEQPPLCHEDERLRVPPREAPPVPEPDPEAVDDVLDDGVDGARRVPERPSGEPTSARLVPWEAGAVGQKHCRPLVRKAKGRCRARRAGANDDHVEALHPAIVEPRRRTVTIARRRKARARVFRNLFKRPKPTGPPEVLRTFSSSDRPITQTGVTVEGDSFRIDVASEGSVPLFEIPDPSVESCVLTYRAKLRTADVERGAYLEMWCRVPDRGEFFSKGLHDKLRGTTDWSSHEIPFLLKKGQRPDLVKLNVAFEGPGTVWIRDVELLRTPLV